jgi:chromosome segregation ATPase
MPDIGIKLGIDVERDFKQSLTEINSSFKVLRSEMVSVSSEFGKNEKSIESASAKNKVLNKEIDAQKKIAMLKNALANASESFGENDKRTQAWVAKLNYAQVDLNKMEQELNETTKFLNQTAKNLNENSKGLDKFGNNAEEAGKKALTLGDIIKVELI